MKKWLKFWIAVVAALWVLATSIIATNDVKAGNTNNITVSIWSFNGWINTCTWSDYAFSFNASPSEQSNTVSNQVTCALWSTANKSITIKLSWDVKTWSLTIPSAGITLASNTWWTQTPSWLITPSTTLNGSLSTAQTLFTKAANKIWTATGTTVWIKVVIPAWQPNGTYKWILFLDF